MSKVDLYFKAKSQQVWTPHTLNTGLGFLGLLIIWLATHNWLGVLGGIVAGLHIAVTIPQRGSSGGGS